MDTYRQRLGVGTPGRVAHTPRLQAEGAGADELMVTTMIYAASERMRSYELLAEAWRE